LCALVPTPRPFVSLVCGLVRAPAPWMRCVVSFVPTCSPGCRVLNCPRLTDVLLLPAARLEACTVQRATVLSSPADPSVVEGGAVVRDALLQWGTHVDTMACVDGAVVCEGGHVDRHGKVLGSLLGPMSGVSEGEVSASLVGPLVGFHHQALLIAALWPEGKGNVG
jgi:hypothetical protein